jgi:formylglycine-generating enzyme required for sulfatase activity
MVGDMFVDVKENYTYNISKPRIARSTIYSNGMIGDMILTGNEKYMYNNTFTVNVSIFVGATSDIVKLTDIYIALESIPARTNTPINFTNSIGTEFLLIPAGEYSMEFNMGSPESEKDRFDNEGQIHHVKISKAFYISKYEVTQKQWRDIMSSNPSHFKGDNLPVENVSWDDIQEFIKKLNKNEGTDKYRLPSEAEWEYAARAGTTTRYSFEVCTIKVCSFKAIINDTTTKYSFGDDESMVGEYAWDKNNSDSKTHEVGQKKPNPWGLYDAHGNVWEWVQDTYHSSYDGAPTNGSAWEGYGSNRVARGGSWAYDAWVLRSALRYGFAPSNRYSDLGFRLLREL